MADNARSRLQEEKGPGVRREYPFRGAGDVRARRGVRDNLSPKHPKGSEKESCTDCDIDKRKLSASQNPPDMQRGEPACVRLARPQSSAPFGEESGLETLCFISVRRGGHVQSERGNEG